MLVVTAKSTLAIAETTTPRRLQPRIDDLETARGITLIHGPLIEDDREEHKCYRHNEGAHAKPNE